MIAFEQQGCRHENSPSSPCSPPAIRLRRLRFPPHVIVLPSAGIAFGSPIDVEEVLAERGIQVDKVTVPTGRSGWDRPIYRPVQPSSATTSAMCSGATGSTACSTNTIDKLHE
jgi:hypothetical protein